MLNQGWLDQEICKTYFATKKFDAGVLNSGDKIKGCETSENLGL